MIYAVIDTNVLVSALITHNPLSATSAVVKLMLDGAFVPLYDQDVIEEYKEVLSRPKFKLLPGVADALVAFFIEHGVEMPRTSFLEPMDDEDGRVFYEITLSKEDSFLVTGNLKHYPQTHKVVSPSDFVDIVLMR